MKGFCRQEKDSIGFCLGRNGSCNKKMVVHCIDARRSI